jgi:two-component system, cell cycle sensor histidine kinase and response regulator CckA
MPLPLHVLLVEDDPNDADLILRELKRSGLEVIHLRVATEDAFLESLHGNLDLILSDYAMPEFDGVRALELLNRSRLEIPFIIVSGTIGEDVAVEMIKYGAADYVSKDRLGRLGTAVQHAFEQKQLRQQREQAEEALRASEERFRQFAESVNEVLWITSADLSTILYVSPSYARVWERTCQSLYERPASFIEAIHEDDRPGVLIAFAKHQQGEALDAEYRIVRPNGQIRWVHARGTVMRNDAGVIQRLGGIAEDITRRKEMERQFRQAQKMEGIGQLAGGVAHDFNNILLVIQANLELVLMTEKNLSLPSKDCMRQIAQAADRAATLNRQLLAFSRKEAMQMRLVDLNYLTASFTKMLRRIVGEHIDIQNEYAPTPPPISADPGMIEQVLMNLVVNARDAMPDGGQIIIGTEEVVIDEDRAQRDARSRAGRFACLSVRDTGSGISPENMSRIFEPFFTTKEAGKGTGLGLATVFGIAKQHKGWVDVSSEVNVGTTFRVFFPISLDVPAGTDLTEGQKIRGGTEKILLVDDDRAVRNVGLQTLENYGYEATEADSADSARKIWAEHGGQFDLLITDMVMPGGLTGLDLADLLRVEKPGLKVLLMSGYSADLARGEPGRAKGVTFLHKPFSTRALAETVRKCLDAD